jgi:DNA-binding MarR family transcriptional regulator
MSTGDGGALALEAFLPYRLNRAAELVSREFAETYSREYGLTRPEWRCLATIGQFGRSTATRIGVHSSMHKTKVSRAIYALEQRRWLKRVEDEADRRVEHLELTPLGRTRYLELAALAHAYQARLAKMLGTRNLSGLLDGLTAVEKTFSES